MEVCPKGTPTRPEPRFNRSWDAGQKRLGVCRPEARPPGGRKPNWGLPLLLQSRLGPRRAPRSFSGR
eukprot:3151537-Lingulodinium_polyedra.AAC.1